MADIFETALAALRQGKVVYMVDRPEYYFINPLGDLVKSVPLGATRCGSQPLRGDYKVSGFATWQIMSDQWIIIDQLPWLK